MSTFTFTSENTLPVIVTCPSFVLPWHVLQAADAFAEDAARSRSGEGDSC